MLARLTMAAGLMLVASGCLHVPDAAGPAPAYLAALSQRGYFLFYQSLEEVIRVLLNELAAEGSLAPEVLQTADKSVISGLKKNGEPFTIAIEPVTEYRYLAYRAVLLGGESGWDAERQVRGQLPGPVYFRTLFLRRKLAFYMESKDLVALLVRELTPIMGKPDVNAAETILSWVTPGGVRFSIRLSGDHRLCKGKTSAVEAVFLFDECKRTKGDVERAESEIRRLCGLE
jgi:hypothetical protein